MRAAPTGPATVLPADVPQLYAPSDGAADALYLPFVLGAAEVFYRSKTHDVEERSRVARLVEPVAGPVPVAWSEGRAVQLELNALSERPDPRLPFGELPDIRLTGAAVKAWTKAFSGFVRTDVPLELWQCGPAKLTSTPGESERDFRVRCQHALREVRDAEREALRDKYAKRMDALQARLAKAQQVVAREAEQAQQRTLDAAISVGTAILGSFLGRRSASATRVGTAVRGVSRIRKESGDVQRARETVASVQASLADMEAELQIELAEVQALASTDVELAPVVVRATSTNIQVRFVGLLWAPYRQTADGRWVSATPILAG